MTKIISLSLFLMQRSHTGVLVGPMFADKHAPAFIRCDNLSLHNPLERSCPEQRFNNVFGGSCPTENKCGESSIPPPLLGPGILLNATQKQSVGVAAMPREWWRRLIVYFVAVSLVGGGLLHLDLPAAPAHDSPAIHDRSFDQHAVDDICFEGPQHPPCGSCFRSVNKGNEILPPGEALCGYGSASVAAVAYRNHAADRRSEGENSIRAPPSIPA